MKKKIKRYLVFVMAIALIATYSFGPQNFRAFAGTDGETQTQATEQKKESEKSEPKASEPEKSEPKVSESNESEPQKSESEVGGSDSGGSSSGENDSNTEEPASGETSQTKDEASGGSLMNSAPAKGVNEEGANNEKTEEDADADKNDEAFEVTFKVDGETVKVVEVNDGEAIGGSNMPSDPKKDNYSFDGWFDGNKEITKDTVVTSSFTATAKFTAIHTVTFYVEDEVYSAKKVKDGQTIGSLPEDPFIAGETFLKWINDPQAGAEVTSGTVVKDDLNVYAVFEDIHIYTVTINYYYKKSDNDTVVFDHNVLTVDGRKIADNPKSVTSPGQVEVDDETAEYHHAEGIVFYPTQQTVIVNAALLETADEENHVVTDVEYVPYTAEYTIVYKLVKANGEEEELDTVEEKGVLGSTVTPPIKNYEFAKLVKADPVKITEATGQVLYVIYEPKDVTLTFDTNGGDNLPSITDKYGKEITLPTPTKTGYDFNGWYKDAACSPDKKVSGTTYTLNANETLYAGWKGAKVDVTVLYMFEKYNDAGTTSAFVYDNSETIQAEVGSTVKATDSIIPDKTKTGWEKDTAQNSTSSVVVKDDGSSVLKVYYKLKTYTIHFNAGTIQTGGFIPQTHNVTATLVGHGPGGTGTLSYSMTVKLGQDISAAWPVNVTGRVRINGRNYNLGFLGWLKQNGTTIFATKRLTVTEDMLPSSGNSVTYTAQWITDSETYTINYWLQNANGNGYTKSDKYSQTIAAYEGGIEMTAKKIPGYTYNSAKDNHKYRGWGLDRYIYEYNYYYDRETYQIDYFDGSTKLNTIDGIKFDANINSATYDYVPETPAGKEGYTWNGWYADSNFASKYTFTTMPASNLALYGKWTAPIQKVTFHNNYEGANPEVFAEQNVPKNDKAEDPGTPVRDYYTFDGWYTKAEGGSRVSLAAYKVTSNTDFYAHWNMTPLKYTVQYLEEGTDKELFPSYSVESPLLELGQKITEEAVAVPGYLPDEVTKSISLVNDPNENIIKFYYSQKNSVNYYSVRYVISGTDIPVAEPKEDIEVDGSTSSVTEMAKAVDKAYMEENGASPEQLENTYHPIDVTQSLTLGQDKTKNVLTFEYLPYKVARFIVKYVDMDDNPIQPEDNSIAKAGSTKTFSTELEGYTLFSNTDNKGGSNKTSYDIAGDEGTITVTLKYQKNLTIRAKDKSKDYDGSPLKSDPNKISGDDADFTAIGLLSGDSITSLSYDGSQTNAGSSATTPKSATVSHTGSNQYYKISYEAGTLTVNAVDVTVTINPDRYTNNTYDGTAKQAGFLKPNSTANDYVTITNTTFKNQYLTQIWAVLQANECLIEETNAGPEDNDYTYELSAAEVDSKLRGPLSQTAAFKDENYNVTLVVRNCQLQIKPKEAEVTTDSDSKTYDGKALTNEKATISGLVPVDNTKVSVTATGSRKDVGSVQNTYTIDWGGVASTNYIISEELGILKVTPAQATVTAENKSKEKNAADPQLTAVVTGLADGDDESVIKYSLNREDGEDVGEYTITPSGDKEQGNYIVEFVTGTLTITESEDEPTPAPTPTPTPTPDGGDNPAGGNGGGTATANAATAAPVAPATIENAPAPTAINDTPAPKAVTAYWALINLLCAIATALLSLIMLGRYFGKRREEDELTGEATETKRGGMARIASLVPAIGAIIALFATENFGGNMAMVDKWTVLMVIILAIQAGVGITAKVRDNNANKEEAAV